MKKVLLVMLAMLLAVAFVFGACQAQDAPAKDDAPAEDAPAKDDAPAEDAPAEDAPAEDAPAEDAPAGEEEILLGYMGLEAINGFWKNIHSSLVEATDAEPRVALTYALFGEADAAKMRSAYDAFIAQNVDFIIDGNGTALLGQTFADEAAAAKIPYLTIEQTCEGAYSYGMSNQAVGELRGEFLTPYVEEIYGGVVDLFVLCTTYSRNVELIPRETGVIDALSKTWPEMAEVEVCEVDTSEGTTVTYQRCMDILTAHPAAEKMIVSAVNDEYIIAALGAWEATNRMDQVMCCSCDCSDVGLALMYEIADGKYDDLYENGHPFKGSVNLAANKYGAFLVDFVIKVLDGEDMPQRNITSPYVVTPETVKAEFPDFDPASV